MTGDTSSKLFKGILSLSTSGVFSMLLGLGNFTIAARFIPQDEFGAFFILFTVVQLLENVSDLGLRLSAPKFLSAAASAEERGRIVRAMFSAKLAVTALVILIIMFMKPLVLALFDRELLEPIYIHLPFLFLALSLDQFLAAIMQGYHLYGRLARVSVVISLCQFLLIVILLWPARMGVQGYILAITLTYALSTAIRFTMIPGPWLPSLDVRQLRDIMAFSYPLAGNNILSFAYRRLDVLIVGALLTPEMVALVGVARRIPETLERLYTSFFAVYFPHVSELLGQGETEAAGEFINKTFRLLTAVTCLGSIFTICLSEEIITLLFGSSYAGIAPLLDLFMVAFTISQVSSVMGYAILASGRSIYTPILSILESTANIAGNFILISTMSFMGTGVARMISVSLSNMAHLYYAHKADLAARSSEYVWLLALLAVAVAAKYALPFHFFLVRLGLFSLTLAAILILSPRTVSDLRGFARSALSYREARS